MKIQEGLTSIDSRHYWFWLPYLIYRVREEKGENYRDGYFNGKKYIILWEKNKIPKYENKVIEDFVPGKFLSPLPLKNRAIWVYNPNHLHTYIHRPRTPDRKIKNI